MPELIDVDQYLRDDFNKKSYYSMTFNNKRIIFVYRDLLIELEDLPEYSLGQLEYDFLLAHWEGSSYLSIDFKSNKRRHISRFICKGRTPEVYNPHVGKRYSDWYCINDILRTCDNHRCSEAKVDRRSITSSKPRRKYNRILLRYDWYLTSKQIYELFNECSYLLRHTYYGGYTNIILKLKSDYLNQVKFQLDNGIIPEITYIQNLQTWHKLDRFILTHQDATGFAGAEGNQDKTDFPMEMILSILMIVSILLAIKSVL